MAATLVGRSTGWRRRHFPQLRCL